MNQAYELPERVLVLHVSAYDPGPASLPDARPWLDAVQAVQRAVPGAVQLSPGWCAMRARGPVRYYGGESEAARAVLECLVSHKGSAAIGVANGGFAARQASLATGPGRHILAPHNGVHIVEAAHTVAFLATLPITSLENEQLEQVLLSLGIRTLGAFAQLPEAAVLQRFGREGALAHRRARGLSIPGVPEIPAAQPVLDFSRTIEFEPPLNSVDQLAFACASYADEFVRALTGHGLVCTELRVRLRDDTETLHERRWSHPSNFTPADVVNRIRWQATAVHAEAEREGAGITGVRIFADRTAVAAAHEPGLWSNAPDERVHHQLTRAQSLLGHAGIGTEVLLGGRLSSDRQAMLPWGVAASSLTHTERSRAGPWPGALEGSRPNIVFDAPMPVILLGDAGRTPVIDSDDLLSDAPTQFGVDPSSLQAVHAWSAPWPLRERWWHSNARTLFRLQLLLATGDAWLLIYDPETGWHAEGRYC